MPRLAAYFHLTQHWQRLYIPLALLLLSGCVSAQHLTDIQQLRATKAECVRAEQAAELTIAKQQVRLLLLRTQLEAQAADLAATTDQLTTERTRRTNLETAANKPPVTESPAPRPDSKAPSPSRELLRRQTAQLESAVRSSRDSVARQAQQLQIAKTSARNLEQTLADRDRTIADLRQRLAAAIRKQGQNAPLNDGRLHVVLPDEPVKALMRAIF